MKRLSRAALVSLVLSAVSVIALAACLFVHYSNIVVDWSRTKDASDVFKNAAEAAAIIGGATWAFFKFRKGRTYQETLGLKVSGKVVPMSGVSYLLITAEPNNIGQSNVSIKREGTGLTLSKYKEPLMLSEVLTVEQTALAGFSVFEFRGRKLVDGSSLNPPPPEILFLLEPNESIEDQRLVALPADLKPALRD